MNEPSTNKELFLKCTCHGEALQIEYEVDKRWNEDGEYWVSLWERGFDGILCWRERLRWVWNILKTGKPFSDHVILSKQDAIKLRDFINEIEGITVDGKIISKILTENKL